MPKTALIAQHNATLLKAAIATLPAPLRETLVLREVQALSYHEIAAVTGELAIVIGKRVDLVH
jgi:DNA-directed RNA polymerase specialized sigma24 family protein